MNPFTSQRSASVAALGEERLIAAIRRWLGATCPPSPHGIGDDCAVLRPSRHARLVTVDPVVFGRHFDATVSPAEAGAKLLKRNISDIAAMGGKPEAAVVALTLDARTKTAWLEGFYRGMAEVAGEYGVQIVGGDVAQADGTLTASLTLIGRATVDRVLTRRGARVGDWICVTGELGNTLRTRHHLRFAPRVAEGAWLARQRAVRSMMDVSDGLAKDLHALVPDGAAIGLDFAALPLRRGATDETALTDGEDYELVFSLAARTDFAAFSRAWRRHFPRTRLSRIGRFVAATDQAAGAFTSKRLRGYEHLR